MQSLCIPVANSNTFIGCDMQVHKTEEEKREEGGVWGNNGAMSNKNVGTYGIVILGHAPMHRSRGVGWSNLSLERDIGREEGRGTVY